MAIIQVDAWTQAQSQAYGSFPSPAVFVPPPAGSQDDVWVEILDHNLISQGPVQYVNLSATLYYNAVGSWSVLVPYTDALWNLILNGEIIVSVNWRGLFTFGGKCEQFGYTSSVPGAASGGAPTAGPFIKLSGADYLALVANRITYPNPAVAWTAQTAGAADSVSGVPLETAIKHYVQRNAGNLARPDRLHPLLDMATDLGRGPNVSYTAKFGTGVDLNMMDVIRALVAQAGVPMGFQITRNLPAHRLTFDVYQPRNFTNKAWFSESLGNLPSIDFYITDPTCTDALVQGASSFITADTALGSGGALGGRTVWNQAEQFTDSSSETDASNLRTTAQTALLTGAAGPNMNAITTDTPFLTFGRDYWLGDIVSVEVRPGAVFSDVISSVQLTADPSQSPAINAVAAIGNSSNATASNQSVIGQLTSRIRTLERKLATK